MNPSARGGRAERAGGVTVRRLGRTRVIDRMVFEIVRQRFAFSSRSRNLACAESRATIMVPVSDSRVLIGRFESVAKISFIG